MCGIDIYIPREKCKSPVHYFTQKGGKKSQNLFFEYHSDNFFGIARTDVDLIGKKKNHWRAPTVTIKKHNKRQIREMENDESE